MKMTANEKMVVGLYRQGFSCDSISVRTGFCTRTIQQILERLGVE